MKKLLLATTIAATLFSASTSFAIAEEKALTKEEKTKHELVGFGGGAVAGAMVGGPLGAVIGGIVGVMIGDDVNDEIVKEYNEQQLIVANSSIAKQRAQLVSLQASVQSLQQEILVQASQQQNISIDELTELLPELRSSVQFRTDSSTIDDTFSRQLENVADWLTAFPNMKVKLTGFADQRGNSEFNQSLSNQRAVAVANFLKDLNVDSKQIVISAFGEASNRDLTKESKEALFFDRRVDIQLVPAKSVLTAAQ